MKQLFNRTISFFNVIESKIAFYPTVLAVFGFIFALVMTYLENLGISKYLVEHAPSLVVNNGDTAKTILSSFISGLISVVVFSFSMVMLLLSQASSNYSPRLLPGLISDKKHQIILGVYLFTILYCIFILFTIQPTGNKYQVPGFAVLIGIVSTVVSIYAFIYFIHNISQSIQISNILQNIFKTAKTRLDQLIEKEKENNRDFENTDGWYEYSSEKSGYLQNISYSNLIDICRKKETKFHILPVKGIFVLNGIPLFKSKKELDEDTVKQILFNFNFAREELVEDNYTLAFKQITEIILKAMSPGINDPGTAINGIDYLTELFALRMRKLDTNMISRDETVFIKMNTIDFADLLYNIMAAIRTYCKHDIILVQKLLMMLHYLKKQQAANDSYYESLDQESIYLLNDAEEAISNKKDIETAKRLASKLNLNFNYNANGTNQ
ncbi:DUF2254 domain-containing protein [Christiangramia forsetii]|uniref:Uncharacterized protein n=2 Tax=Christiangramia forsetii TaxID=411153 RepID=A0M3R5_CHRFK|nr:DUF2254 domain-containing protein [Christiangramia forsetii]GGG25168.1 hypothetical protein GCM10011532_05650 [Christiangramia forsetii]CAL67260.1 conserved hypothetical protein, membrane [Christiangramia forsetii KT0803]